LKKSKPLLLMAIMLLLGVSLFAGGCGTYAKKTVPQPTTPAPNTKMTPNETSPGEASATDIANRAAIEAGKVTGVNAAAAIVADRVIYLGLDLNADVDNNESAAIEKNVMERVNNMERGYTARVTSDKATVAAIRTVAQGVAQGKPVSSFKQELNSIMAKMKS